MRIPYLALRPFNGWSVNSSLALSNGVQIRRLSEQVAPELYGWSEVLSKRQIRQLTEQKWWFCFEFQDEPVRPTDVQNHAIQRLFDASLAFFLASPSDNEGTTILCQDLEGKWRPVTLLHDPDFHSTKWARMFAIQAIPLATLQKSLEGITKAAGGSIIRLMNPMQFLEHGLQSRNLHLRIFLWTTGLDALLMSPNRAKFVGRIGSFLGTDSFVFPVLPSFGLPKYRVGEVASDLYDLRSCIAHGKEIPDKFRQSSGFVDINGHLIDGYEKDFQYRQVLEECALFLLCRALTKVYECGLVEKVANASQWRQVLEAGD